MSSCGQTYKETLLTDISTYSEHLVLPERRASEKSSLFPDDITGIDAVNFVCFHKTEIPVGTQWQVELVVRYSLDEFIEEENRIKILCESSPVFESSEHFKTKVYASVWNWHGCYEYAVVNSEEFSIAYIYLQLASENLVINENYMPIDYSMTLEEGEWTVY